MTEKIKLCKDCAWYRNKYKCARRSGSNTDIVTGKVHQYMSDCYTERSSLSGGECKTEGKYFQPRPSLWARIIEWWRGI